MCAQKEIKLLTQHIMKINQVYSQTNNRNRCYSFLFLINTIYQIPDVSMHNLTSSSGFKNKQLDVKK